MQPKSILPILMFALACSEADRHAGTTAGAGTISSGGVPAAGGSTTTSGGSVRSGGANSGGRNGGTSGTPTGGTASGSAGGSSSSAGAGMLGDDLFFVPEGLPNTLAEGEEGKTLTLVAFSLLQGSTGAELFAAVRNDGAAPSCEAGMLTYFLDRSGQLVATVGSVLLSKRPYRLETGEIIRCIAPGEVAMTASTELPAEIVLENLASLSHRFPAFTVDGVVPIDAYSLADITSVSTEDGRHAYTGVFGNQLDQKASQPSVTIFPLNAVGRPLGVATSKADIDIAPGEKWVFRTSAVDGLGADYVAYPSAVPRN